MPLKTVYLKSNQDFKNTIKEGRKFKSPHFILYSKEKHAQPTKLGIRISKVAVSLAVGRNRVRRIIREFWRTQNTGKLPYRNLVLVVKKGSDRLDNEEIRREIAYILNRVIS